MLSVVLLIVGWSSPADARDDDRQKLLGEERGKEVCAPGAGEAEGDAKELTMLGVSCFKAESYAQAYTYYHRAYEVEKSDLLRAAMGRSLHELGIYGVARHYYESFLDNKRGTESAGKIEERLEQLDRDVESNGAEVRLTSFPPNARVHVRLHNGDWVELGRTPTKMELETGRYTFRYARDNYRSRRVTRGVDASNNPAEVEAELYHVESAFDVTGHGLKRAGVVTLIASAPLITGGAVLFGLSADKFAEAEDYTYEADYVPARQNRMIETGHRFQQWAIGLTAVGTATLLTGGILFLRGQAIESKENASTSARLHPVVSPRFVGLRARF